jgi:prepilin-type N-terminal cleavage/methylation domain-containing protein
MTRLRAFTLVEMLAAIVLSGLLMVGVLSVVRNLGAAGSPVAAQLAPHAVAGADDIDRWVELLREDLDHADEVDASVPNELTLTGHGALGEANCEQTHRPARVQYKLQDIGGRPWLIRRQAALDVLTNDNVQRDLVCHGVKRFELVCSAGAAPVGQGGRGRKASVSWRVRAWADNQDQPLCDRFVTVQGGGDL